MILLLDDPPQTGVTRVVTGPHQSTVAPSPHVRTVAPSPHVLTFGSR